MALRGAIFDLDGTLVDTNWDHVRAWQVAFTALGYVLHSRWSFKGYGDRDRPGLRGLKFLAVNSFGFLINQGFIWFLVKHLGGPIWWSVIPILFVTPLVTFSLNRHWVFS